METNTDRSQLVPFPNMDRSDCELRIRYNDIYVSYWNIPT
jgi:hypothetical protein